MVKLSLSPWLSSWSSHTRSNVERKKLNPRTFPGFSPSSPLAEVDISNSKPASSTTSCENTMAIREPTTTSATNSMVALAEKISRETAKLESHIKLRGLPMPSFDADAPSDFPKLPDEIQLCRIEIVNATKQLRDLAVGPRESIRWGVWDFLDVLALQIIYGFGLAKLVPLDKPIHLNDLQKLTPLDPVNLARTLRTAMTNHIFTEPSPDMIAHTAASRLLATDSELAAWVGFNTDDIFPAANGVLTALRTHPEATSLTQSGFQYAFNTVDIEPMFTTFGHDAERARRMGLAMASLTGGEGYEVSYFVDEYDFGDIDARGGLLADVGGSHGFVSVSLARKWKNMRFIVQDLEKTVDSAPRPICGDRQVADRVQFMSHDFFTPQTVAADVYYFRWIIHNYSTPYAVSILRNLIPVLRPGNRIIINDHCLRDPGKENAWDEKIMRRMDMVMLTLLNAQERTEADFKELFRLADDGFVFKGVTRPNGCRMSIIEAVWKPDEYVSLSA